MNTSAETFRRLHAGPQPLVLVNAWDAASARVIERAGAAAIATTSAGIAWSLGHADGERLAPAELLAACERICSAVKVPVSVDIERGFGRDTAAVVALVDALAAMGVAGINIEDGIDPATGRLHAADVLAERIASVRARHAGLFINARTDVHFLPVTPQSFDEALQRARQYTAAGADGIFMPGLADPDAVRRMAAAIERPLNVYAGYAGAASVARLAAAGACRISVGCGAMQSVLGLLGRIATEAFEHGRFDTMGQGMASVAELNRLFAPA